MKKQQIVLLFLILFPSFMYSEPMKPRIAVIEIKNTSEDSMIESVCETVTDTIELTLQLLNKYQIIRADYVDIYTDFTEAKQFFHDFNIDNAVFGIYLSDEEGKYAFEVSVYDRSVDSIIIQNRIEFLNILDSFEKAEELAVRVLEEFSDEHIAFGSLLFLNDGEPGDYEVVIDGSFTLRNPIEIPMLVGDHNLKVRKIEEDGFEEVYSENIAIKENAEHTITFSLTEEMEAVLIQEKSINTEESVIDLPEDTREMESAIQSENNFVNIFGDRHLDYYLFTKTGGLFGKYTFEGNTFGADAFSLKKPIVLIKDRPYLDAATKLRINRYMKIGRPSMATAIAGLGLTLSSFVFLAFELEAATYITIGSGMVLSFTSAFINMANSPFKVIQAYNNHVKNLYYDSYYKNKNDSKRLEIIPSDKKRRQ